MFENNTAVVANWFKTFRNVSLYQNYFDPYQVMNGYILAQIKLI